MYKFLLAIKKKKNWKMYKDPLATNFSSQLLIEKNKKKFITCSSLSVKKFHFSKHFFEIFHPYIPLFHPFLSIKISLNCLLKIWNYETREIQPFSTQKKKFPTRKFTIPLNTPTKNFITTMSMKLFEEQRCYIDFPTYSGDRSTYILQAYYPLCYRQILMYVHRIWVILETSIPIWWQASSL